MILFVRFVFVFAFLGFNAIAFPAVPNKTSVAIWNIYVPGSYTGFMPFLADGTQKAETAFSKEVNAKGGLLGRKLNVIMQDDRGDLATAEKNARVALADENHLVTVGHSFSSFALPIGRLYARSKKLFFTPYATSEKVSDIKGTVFQLCFNDVFQGRTLATVAINRLHAKRIFVMRNESDTYSEGLAKQFVQFAEKFPTRSQIKQYRYIFDKLQTDDMIKAIREQQPDIIFLPELKVRAAEIVRRLSANGLGHIPLLGADGWGSEDGTLDIFFSGVKSSHSGKYFYTYHWHPDINTARNKAIKKSIARLTGAQPYGPGVLTFEALLNLQKVSELKKTADGLELAHALRGKSFEGVTGLVRYLEDGTTERHLVLLQLTPNGLFLDSLVKPD